MVKKQDIVLSKAGFRELLNAPAVRAELMRYARQIAETAGGEDMGYKVTDLMLEESRAAVSVMATGHAHFHNRKHHALLKALEAGRG